jgi:macrodomain Ter protein organizer (MatP/YcbG family)
MSKTIQFTYNDVDYTLEYTRKTLEKMETDGIVLAEMNKKPVTILPKLFRYAFYAHHKHIKKQEVENIFQLFTNKTEMYQKLSEMANDTLNTLFEEKDQKNAISWKASF